MDARLHAQPTALELFTPKLVTVFREGYGLADLRADALAGLTVAIVALPLSMAIAIASGVGPERGLYTAIVGGFLVSLLGGSRVQIGGPAGAFIVLVAATVQRHGYDGLVLATLMAGAIMVVVGLFRLGAYIKYIPYPVTAGFTAGIATIILASQLKDLFGLDLAHEPAEFIPKLAALWAAAGTVRPSADRHRARRADPDRGAAARAPALAGLPDRDRAGGGGRRRARPRRRDHRLALRRHPELAAEPVAARVHASRRRMRCCPMRSPSRCSARSSRCCRRSSRTGSPAGGIARTANWSRRASPMRAR